MAGSKHRPLLSSLTTLSPLWNNSVELMMQYFIKIKCDTELPHDVLSMVARKRKAYWRYTCTVHWSGNALKRRTYICSVPLNSFFTTRTYIGHIWVFSLMLQYAHRLPSPYLFRQFPEFALACCEQSEILSESDISMATCYHVQWCHYKMSESESHFVLWWPIQRE